MDGATVASLLISLAAVVVAVAAWKSSARTANRAEDIARRTMHAAYRPYVSIDLYPIEGTGPSLVNFASVLHNHGNVPATITEAWSRIAGSGTIASGSQLQPNQNPSQLCIFPGRDAELTWGASRTSATWPDGGFLSILVEITYRGTFEGTKYTTRVEATCPIPDATMIRRGDRPMDVRRAEAT